MEAMTDEITRRVQPQARRPNIVFIIADDMGYADVSCYGRRDLVTPNIDRMASQGVRFTQGYASSPVCTGSRVAIIIKARLLAINSADDERNPPELGILEREIKRVKNGRYVLIPGSEETRGHGTTGLAKLWKHHLAELLQPAVQAAK